VWTTVDDVLGRWAGSPPPDDHDLIETIVRDAERVLLELFPDIPDRLYDPDDLPTLLPDRPLPEPLLVQVVAQMTIRHLRNPDAVRQTTETEGPFSRNRTFAGDRPGSLWPTPEERELLGYPSGVGQSAFTIAPGTGETSWLGGAGVW
jgi:hypothetical protein